MALIKSDQAAGRIGPVKAAPPPLAPDPERLALTAELADLRAELDRARAEAARRAAEADTRVTQAREAGEVAGRAQAEARHTEALDRLALTLETAGSRLEAELSGLERLAGRLAQAALARVFEDPAEPARLVEQALLRQVAMLRDQAILGAEVSVTDFPDPAALTRLAERLGGRGLDVRALPELAAGEARLALQLGSLELGLGLQWDRLSGALARMSSAEAVG